MSEENTNTVVAIESTDGRSVQLVDPTTSKLEQVELEFEEVKANLLNSANNLEPAIKELIGLAGSARHHLVYAALAKLIEAHNGTHRELTNVLKHKTDLILNQKKENDSVIPQQPTHVVNNTLNVTTTDLIDLMKKKHGIQE